MATDPNTAATSLTPTAASLRSLNSQPDHISDLIAGVMSGCTYTQAFFSSYLYERNRVQTLLHDNPLFEVIKTAATDGRHIYMNEGFILSLTPDERIGVLCHEITHDMLMHTALMRQFSELGAVPRPDGSGELPYDAKMLNIAMDAVNNRMLLSCGLHLPANRVEFDWVTDEDDLLSVYARLFDENGGGKGKSDAGKSDAGDGKGAGGEGADGAAGAAGASTMRGSKGGDGFDTHALPDAPDTEADQEARKHALASAIAAGERAGTVPANMKRWLDRLNDAKVPWTKVLADLMQRVNGQDSLDWHRMHRRSFLLVGTVNPRRKSEHCPPIVLLVDTSGSTARFVNQFLSEAGAIASELSPSAIHILWVDTRVAHVDTLEDAEARDFANLTVHGGGGTDLRAGFDWLDDNEHMLDGTPAALVILTDGETPWPTTRPDFPVICATTNTRLSYPDWMDVVEVVP